MDPARGGAAGAVGFVTRCCANAADVAHNGAHNTVSNCQRSQTLPRASAAIHALNTGERRLRRTGFLLPYPSSSSVIPYP
jgi:hypothetical protein